MSREKELTGTKINETDTKHTWVMEGIGINRIGYGVGGVGCKGIQE